MTDAKGGRHCRCCDEKGGACEGLPAPEPRVDITEAINAIETRWKNLGGHPRVTCDCELCSNARHETARWVYPAAPAQDVAGLETRAIMCGHCHGIVYEGDDVGRSIDGMHGSCWHTGTPRFVELVEREQASAGTRMPPGWDAPTAPHLGHLNECTPSRPKDRECPHPYHQRMPPDEPGGED